MKEKIVTENAEIEVLANGEAISLCLTETEFEGPAVVCSWLDDEQLHRLVGLLLDALCECYPDYADIYIEDMDFN